MFNNPNITPQLFLNAGAGLLQGNTWQNQVGNAFSGANTALTAATEDAKKKALEAKQLAFLQGVAPDYAGAVQSGVLGADDAYKLMLENRKQPDLEFHVLPDGTYGTFNKKTSQFNTIGQATKPAELPSSAQEYNFAKQNGFTGTFMDWQKAKAGSDEKLGLNPVPGVDANNNPVLMQLSTAGNTQLVKMPDGVKVSKEPIKIDAGTTWILLDPITRQTIGSLPKDVAGVSTQQTLGKTQGEIQASLAGAKQTAEMVKNGVQDLINDPGLSGAVGPVDSRLPTFLPSTARAESKINMLKGQAFMQARQLLKGGGQITDFEGQRAEDAYARMSTAQSEDDFKKALVDFNSAVQDGVAKLEAQSQGQWDYAKPQTQNTTTPTRINNSADYAKLPSGAQYIDPNGILRTKGN